MGNIMLSVTYSYYIIFYGKWNPSFSYLKQQKYILINLATENGTILMNSCNKKSISQFKIYSVTLEGPHQKQSFV